MESGAFDLELLFRVARGGDAHRSVGQLADHGGAGGAVVGGGRDGHTPVRGELHGDVEPLDDVAVKEHVGIERRAEEAVALYVEAELGGRGKHRAGRVESRHKAEHLALIEGGGYAVQLAGDRDGHAHKYEHILPRRLAGNALKLRHGLVRKRALEKEMAAGGARETELGRNEKLNALFLRRLHALDDAVRVAAGVCHSYPRRRGGDLDKSVFHLLFLPYLYQNNPLFIPAE